MDYLIDLGVFWSRYGDVVLTTIFWVLVMWLLLKGVSKKAIFLQELVDDLSESNEKGMKRIVSLDDELFTLKKKLSMSEDAWLAAKNENLKLKRENHLLKEKISKKQEFRLRNGLWCTEEQYLAEKNGLTVTEQLDEMAKETHGAIASADINEECNKQIDSFLANSDQKYSQEEKDAVVEGMMKELDEK